MNNQMLKPASWLRTCILFTALLASAFATPISAQEGERLELSLVQARAYGVENSYFTRQARLEELKSDKRVKELLGMGLPQIDAEANFQNFLEIPTSLVPNFTDPSPGAPEYIPLQFGTDYNVSAGATLSQLIYDGSYFVGRRAANAYRDLATNIRVKSEQEIKDAITEAYANAVVAEENVRILALNKAYLDTLYTENVALYEQGFIEEQDATQIKLLLLSARSQYDNAVRMQNISLNMVKFQLGMPLERDLVLTDDLDAVLAYGENKGVLAQEFDVNAHFDYVVALSQERMQELNLQNSKAQYHPGLYGFMNYQQTFQYNELTLGDGDYWFPSSLWGLSLKVPIFSSFQRKFNVDQARIDYEVQQINSEKVETQLTLEFLSNKSSYIAALSVYENTKTNLELVESILKKESIKYSEGLSSSLNLANTQIQFYQIQATYVQAVVSLVQAKSELDKALNNY